MNLISKWVFVFGQHTTIAKKGVFLKISQIRFAVEYNDIMKLMPEYNHLGDIDISRGIGKCS